MDELMMLWSLFVHNKVQQGTIMAGFGDDRTFNKKRR